MRMAHVEQPSHRHAHSSFLHRPSCTSLRETRSQTHSEQPYTPDPRDDLDPLAPPLNLRSVSFETTGETYDLRHKSLSEMRQKVEQFDSRQGHIANATIASTSNASVIVNFERKDDMFLMVFLRSKMFHVERAFAKYVNFCKAHTEHVWLKNVDLDLVRALFKEGCYSIFPCIDGVDRMILSMDIKTLSPFMDTLGKKKADAFLVAIFGMLETVMLDVRAQVYGISIVADLTGCKMKTFGYLSVPQYLLSLDLCQNCYPIRTSGMYMIHEPWYVKGLMNIMRPFMKKSVKENMLCFGADIESIHKYIPKEALLPMYGGTLDIDLEANAKMWIDAVRSRLS